MTVLHPSQVQKDPEHSPTPALVRPAARPPLARRMWQSLFLICIASLLGWLAGFVLFVRSTEQSPALPAHADGIVVLTGGADRVATALHLLASGKADRMLVTGIGGGAALHDLAGHSDVEAKGLADRVTLGRGAASTHGNAAETALWVQQNGVHSLILVTACYHIPRAVTEMHRALPSVIIYPAPVYPSGFRIASWNALRLLAQEYTKFLAARMGLTALSRDPKPALSVAGPTHGLT